MRLRRLLLGGMLPLVLAALLAGCGGDEKSVDTGGAGDAAKASRTVDVQITPTGYIPPTIDVAKGETVTFNVTNNDTTVHEFALGDDKVQDDHEKYMSSMSKQPMENMADTPNVIAVKAGQSKAITWAFPNGKTTVIYGSHQPNDYARGLKGTIKVK